MSELTNDSARAEILRRFCYDSPPPPGSTLETLALYAIYGIPTGDFLYSVLTNDLYGSFMRADGFNGPALKSICGIIYSCTPSGCHGTSQRITEWVEARRGHPLQRSLVPASIQLLADAAGVRFPDDK